MVLTKEQQIAYDKMWDAINSIIPNEEPMKHINKEYDVNGWNISFSFSTSLYDGTKCEKLDISLLIFDMGTKPSFRSSKNWELKGIISHNWKIKPNRLLTFKKKIDKYLGLE